MAGNSGLFSTLTDMITYMQLMLNKGKKTFSLRIFSEQVVDLFTTKV
jgi:CubicO group peptidase (beta-lactamase class C family)